MTLFFGIDCWRIFPITINVQILVVESCWRVVPFSHFDWFVLVGDIDNVEAIRPAVGVVVLGNWVQIAVG